MTAAVVLAAGLSRRMGQAKLLLPVRGSTVVWHTVQGVLGAGVKPVVIVTGREHEAIAQALVGVPVDIALNDHPEAGQASSIRAGVAALPAGAEAVLIVLGDQPFLDDRIIPALVAARSDTGKPIAAPRYRDGRGNPVLFSRSVFPELLEVRGDQGARAVVERDPDRVALVEFDFSMPPDLDTPEDYERLLSQRQTR
ncbi:MAG: nucleotidyltransferase family protein [Candidatus Rokuibacteriota bacterium]|nr:MAG: nucleotidyltransferase family protein [Candidatus Rokubacteria bacterium]